MTHAEEPTETWDAGPLGCGELLIELRRRIRSHSPNTVVRVISTDPGAPEDIPAWCRITGTSLLHQQTLSPGRFLFDLRA